MKINEHFQIDFTGITHIFTTILQLITDILDKVLFFFLKSSRDLQLSTFEVKVTSIIYQ